MKLKRLRPGDLIEVTWDDATGDSSWVLVSETKKWPTMRCRTVGYFLQQSDRAVMLCDSLFEDWQAPDGSGTVGGVTTIPRRMVTSVRLLGSEE